MESASANCSVQKGNKKGAKRGKYFKSKANNFKSNASNSKSQVCNSKGKFEDSPVLDQVSPLFELEKSSQVSDTSTEIKSKNGSKLKISKLKNDKFSSKKKQDSVGNDPVTISSQKEEPKSSAILDINLGSLIEDQNISKQKSGVVVKSFIEKPQFADVTLLRLTDSSPEIGQSTTTAKTDKLLRTSCDSIYEKLFEKNLEIGENQSANDDDEVFENIKAITTLNDEYKPIPKPRTSLKSTSNQSDSNNSSHNGVIFGPPEERNCIVRATSAESLAILTLLDDFVKVDSAQEMDSGKVKRSNSIKNRIKSIFQKEKKPKVDNKKTRKTENAVFADNAQNENFNRGTPCRHTLDAPRRETGPLTMGQHQPLQRQTYPDPKEVETRYAQMHINRYQQARLSFENHALYQTNNEYVPMDSKIQNSSFANINNKFAERDSSSTNTLESAQSVASNPAEQLRQTRNAMRNKFFQDTPPRAQETYQNVELINPREQGVLNNESPLQNSYSQVSNNFNLKQENIHFDADLRRGNLSPRSHEERNSRPTSPLIEPVKLRLPPNREKVDLHPRVKSPIPPSEVSADKQIATELLRNKNARAKSPSHQRLEIEIDYPKDQSQHSPQNLISFHQRSPNNLSYQQQQQSPKQLLEAGEWHRQQRELNQSPPVKLPTQTTNAIVHHVESPTCSASTASQEDRSRTCTPVNLRSPSPSVQRSPPKAEIRNTVQQFCWRELKKLKEREDMETQLLLMTINNANPATDGLRMQSSVGGYAEDPIISHRSRSLVTAPRNTKRSSSLPREVLRQRRQEEDLQSRGLYARTRPINGQPNRPIFNRGSLVAHHAQATTPIDNKRVTFNSERHQNPGPWPTKNGFTKSPPSRRIDRNAEDQTDSKRDPTGNEIFLINQQRQRELLNQRMQHQQLKSEESPYGTTRTHSEVIYGNRANPNNESPYGTRQSLPTHFNNQVTMRESPYATCDNESPYGTRHTVGTTNEPLYATRMSNGPANVESPYGSRINPSNVVTRPNEPIYVVRQVRQNVPPNNLALRHESPYGTRNAIPTSHIIYGTRQNPDGPVESPYGTRQSPSGVPHEHVYGTKQNPQGISRLPPDGGNFDCVYGTRMHPNGSPQGRYLPMSKPLQNNDAIYGSRNLPQRNTAEPIYGMRTNPGKPPSGVQFRNRPNISPESRYDYPPSDVPMSPTKKVTVNNKVCDFYGKIHDNGAMVSPPPTQRAGVLYGQLQRNANVSPAQYQSYQQVNPNFTRGTRLTASVNDMHRYNNKAPSSAGSEPPNRPLPPVPGESKTKFGFKKKPKNCKGKS